MKASVAPRADEAEMAPDTFSVHPRKYLLEHLDSSYEARFVSPDFGPSMSYGVPKEYENLITGIEARLAVLRRFIEGLRD